MSLVCGRPPRSAPDPFFADWPDGGIALAFKHWSIFAHGVCTTAELTFFSLALGICIAVPCALVLARRTPVVFRFVSAYVYIFRGSPLLVQAYLIYYGLSQFVFVRESFLWPFLREAYWCALLAFTLNTGAYTSELLRGALAAAPKGEGEAAKALGLSRRQITWLVELPSAFRRALPQYGNEIIFMLHGSVVASVITIQDILGVGRTVNAKYYVAYEGFLTAAVLYMALTFLIVLIFRGIEGRLLRHIFVRQSMDKQKARPA
ncbi:MAG: ABC transporter permease subunit [Rhizobiales bacterium]|nr:ABC transporter permease subunit [Hyphomicrobiales bacterium]